MLVSSGKEGQAVVFTERMNNATTLLFLRSVRRARRRSDALLFRLPELPDQVLDSGHEGKKREYEGKIIGHDPLSYGG